MSNVCIYIYIICTVQNQVYARVLQRRRKGLCRSQNDTSHQLRRNCGSHECSNRVFPSAATSNETGVHPNQCHVFCLLEDLEGQLVLNNIKKTTLQFTTLKHLSKIHGEFLRKNSVMLNHQDIIRFHFLKPSK